MGPIICPEASVRIYHFSLRNSPEERSSQPRNISLTELDVRLQMNWDLSKSQAAVLLTELWLSDFRTLLGFYFLG